MSDRLRQPKTTSLAETEEKLKETGEPSWGDDDEEEDDDFEDPDEDEDQEMKD